MTNKNIQNKILMRYQDLKKSIHYHNDKYHSQDAPEISDYDYDLLFQELLDLEKQYPDLDQSDSPSQKVGSQIITGFQKATHRTPMLSLGNSYNEEDIIDFDQRVKKFLRDPLIEIEYFAELKLDGLSIELIYESGQLTKAITRGDGLIGEDVTHNVKTIKTIPHKIKHSSLLEVRGEILIEKADFVLLNQQNEELGLNTFANSRNAAAGAIRQLDSKIAASRPLKFYAYSLGQAENIEFVSQSDLEIKLKKLGFPVIDSSHTVSSSKVDTLIEYYKKIQSIRSKLPFDIDGIVIKVNSFSLQNELGFVARSPRWATAVKFQPEQAQSIIENIIVQVGRTGALTPVALLTPTQVGGVTITHATLHNQDEINRKDIRIGDTVIIQRAGDVIPQIVNVIHDKRPLSSSPFLIPTKCPVCFTETEKPEGEVISRCPNVFCKSVLIESIKHFCSRRALNIEKIGDKIAEALVEKELVRHFSDLYSLTFEKLQTLDRQGEKSIQNILNSIEKSKNTTLAKLIYGLGLRYVGEQTAKLLADHFITLDQFVKTNAQELELVPEIGEKVSASIMQKLTDKKFQEEVNRLLRVGFIFETIQRNQDGPLKGLSFVVTGTLPLKRDEALKIIESNGGKILSGVSAKLSYLIAGDDPGSKVDKAKSVGCKIIDWNEFLKLIP